MRHSCGYVGATLAALSRPLSLTAIALLLLNDHLLKASVPSLLTGKLSDFAGLYFAPYLLLALIFRIVDRPRPDAARRIAIGTYAAVALSFTILKTSGAAAAWAQNAVAAVIGLPPMFVVDPSDVVALSVLLFSYRAWSAVLRSRHSTTPRTRVLGRAMTLVIASAAVLATSSTPPPSVTSIAASETEPDVLYAVLKYTKGGNDGTYVSRDGGTSWRRIEASAGTVYVDPATPGRLYLLGPEIWNPRLLHLSDDGTAVTEIGTPDIGPRPNVLRVNGPTTLVGVRWDPAILFLLHNGDLFRRDSDRIWQKYGLGGIGVTAVAASASPGVVYGASESGLFRTDDGGRIWRPVSTVGPISALAVSPADADVVIAGVGNQLRMSTDGGQTWGTKFSYPSLSATSTDWQSQFDRRDPSRVYVLVGAGCCAPMVTENGGRTWHQWTGRELSGIAVTASPEHPLLATGPRGDALYRRTGGSSGTWVAIGRDLPLGAP